MAQTNSAGDRWDHRITRGTSWSLGATWLNDDGTPHVITSGTFTITVKTAADSSGTSAGTITASIVSGTGGTFTVQQTAAQVAAMTAGTYWWSGRFTPSGGEAQALWHGTFAVDDVTEA